MNLQSKIATAIGWRAYPFYEEEGNARNCRTTVACEIYFCTTVEQQLRAREGLAQLSATVVQIVGIVVVADFGG
jgi:hypothetical protein